MSNETQSLTSPISAAEASSLANNSTALANESAALGPDVQLSYAGIFLLSNVDDSSCYVQLESLNVVYDFLSSNQTGQFTISENATTGAVLNASVQSAAGESASHGASGDWAGYAIGTCDACSPHGTYAQWQNFGITPPSNECGADETVVGICEISFWSGLSATQNGGGSQQGIAQSGFNAWLTCDWLLGEYFCQPEYQAWIQYWPSNPVNCFSFSSSSDELISEVSWESPNIYITQIWDVTTGQECSPYGWATMSMGAPSYGQFQSEPFSNGVGGIYDVPDFSAVWFYGMVVLGDPANLSLDNPHPFVGVPGVGVGGLSYDQYAWCDSGETCIDEWT